MGLTVWLLIGGGVFVGGDWLVDRRFGGAVATPARATEAGNNPAEQAEGAEGALGIVLGSVVDGVPESLIFGIGVAAVLSLYYPGERRHLLVPREPCCHWYGGH